jgi:Carboxylesterase family
MAYKVAAIVPSFREKWVLAKSAKERRPVLFWTIFTVILIIMFVPAIVLGLFFRLSKTAAAFNVSLTVDLGYAKYQGAYAASGVSQWFGIRYAAPPVGDLRFRAPADPVPNDVVQVADKVCLQFSGPSLAKINNLSMDHYAITLHPRIWTPAIQKIACSSTSTLQLRM